MTTTKPYLPLDPLGEGQRAGIERASNYDLSAPDYVLVEPLDLTRSTLADSGIEISDRFAVLFAEAVTIAAVARHVYGDEPLVESDIRSFLETLVRFLNSFTHK